MSRIPVREALRQLEAEGLVTFSPHRGAVVSSLSLEEIDELFELRADIECDLLSRAIPRMTRSSSIARRDVLDEFEDALRAGEATRWGPLNWHFHAALYAPADAQLHDGRAPEAASAQRSIFPDAGVARQWRHARQRGASRDRGGGAK